MSAKTNRYWFLGAVLLGSALACAIPGVTITTPGTEPPSNEEAVQTAIALTLQAPPAAGATETPVPTGAASSTETPTVSPTASGTLLPTNTATATPTVPIITVSTATNCRYGPGVVYDPPVDVLDVNETAQVFGRDSGSNFYYISLGCWVWTQHVVLIAGNLAALPVFTPPPTPTPTPTTSNLPWNGTWETQCGTSSCETMTLVQTGATVAGTYANGDGTITGVVDNNHLTGTWVRGFTSGSFDFWLNNAKDKWRGNWDLTNEWCGARPGVNLPSPCSVSTWYGDWITNCGIANCGTMTLTQNGTEVDGTYANGTATVDGSVNGTTFTGTWTRGTGSGTFTFYMTPAGDQFSGNWDGTNAWCGHRQGSVDPPVCFLPQ